MQSASSEAGLDTQPIMPLSVVLPNFNDGKVLPRALRSLLAQKPAAAEIIVVDDGSSDNSVSVVEELQARHPSIRLIRNETNLGIVASVRRALDVATGEFLLCASSDDFVLPGLFDRAFNALRKNPAAAFFCASVALADSRDQIMGIRPVTTPRLSPGYLSPADVRRAIRRTDFWVLGTSTVYRRKLLAEIGYFDPSLGSIGDVLANRLLAFQHGFYFDPAVLGVYNKDPGSFSGRSALSVKNSRQVLDAAQSWMAAKLPEDIREQHARLFDRRMRFGLARLQVIWRSGSLDSDAVSDLLNFGPFDRKVLKVLATVPLISGVLTLGWMALRLRPFGIVGVFAAIWRAYSFKWFGRVAVQRQIDQIASAGETTPAHTT
jgi:glycosyltransferase involved in cell wall biosynthesis